MPLDLDKDALIQALLRQIDHLTNNAVHLEKLAAGQARKIDELRSLLKEAGNNAA